MIKLNPTLLSIVLVVCLGALSYGKLDSPDFKVFYTAAGHAMEDPSKIYADSPDRFLYPPPAALFFVPFHLLPSWEVNQFVWFLVTLLLIFALIRKSWWHLLTGVILLRYFIMNLRYGQVNVLILVLLFLAHVISKNKRYEWAALFLFAHWLRLPKGLLKKIVA